MKACTLWYKDTAGGMDDVAMADAVVQAREFAVNNDKININVPLPQPKYPDGSKNEGLRKRHAVVHGSNTITLLDRLHLDLFQQDKFIPNGVDIRLRFNRTKPNFYMMTAAGSTGKVVIQNMLLWVRNSDLVPRW